jgi:hypothetical protein
MISLKEYLMGRDSKYTLTEEFKRNAEELLSRVNKLALIAPKELKVSSGWRPGEFNRLAGGAPNSAHVTCEAVDLKDSQEVLDQWLTDAILTQFDLYREHPSKTVGWVHLTTRAPKSKKRTFLP